MIGDQVSRPRVASSDKRTADTPTYIPLLSSSSALTTHALTLTSLRLQYCICVPFKHLPSTITAAAELLGPTIVPCLT